MTTKKTPTPKRKVTPLPTAKLPPKPKRVKGQVNTETPNNKEVFLTQLELDLGNISSTSRTTGISRQTVYQWISADPIFAGRVEEIKEVAINFVEGALMRSILSGNVTAQIFFLKCKGKHKGWIDTPYQDNTGTLKAEIVFTNEAKTYKDENGESTDKVTTVPSEPTDNS